jgi:hypothetical protein
MIATKARERLVTLIWALPGVIPARATVRFRFQVSPRDSYCVGGKGNALGWWIIFCAVGVKSLFSYIQDSR